MLPIILYAAILTDPVQICQCSEHTEYTNLLNKSAH